MMNLAIVSTNQQQYSETFIHNHVKLLPANVHFLCEGYLPKKYSTDKGLTLHTIKQDKKLKWFSFKRSKPVSDYEQQCNAVSAYLTENNIGLILCEYGPSGVAMLPVSKRTNIPMVVYFHGYDAYRDDVLSSYGKQYPELFSHAEAIIGVSKHMCTQLKTLGCPSSKLHLMPCGIDTDIFNIKNNVTKEITFVACGRFVEKKAPQLTLQAFAETLEKIPAATLVMIGAGGLLDECTALAQKLGIAHAVDFKGALSQEQIAEIFSRSLVFIQHSVTTADHDSEGTPLTVLESGACGLPVVSTHHGGISDVIKDGETGFLVKEKDVSAMAEKMLLLAHQPALAQSIGQKAAELVRSNYDLRHYTQNLWQLLQNSAERTG